jgi:hypothetical protein
MAAFQPPPTHTSPIIVDEVTGRATFSPVWLRWFLDVATFLSGTGSSGGGSTGTGDFVRQVGPTINSPALTTPNIGIANGTSLTLSGGFSVTTISATTLTLTGALTGAAISGTTLSLSGAFTGAAISGTTLNLSGALTGAAISGTTLNLTGALTGAALSGTTLGLTGTLTGAAITGTTLTLTGALSGAAISGTTLTLTGLLTVQGGATLLKANTALTDGAAAAAGTLTNAPTAGDPTKWIAIDDAGTTRYIPAW